MSYNWNDWYKNVCEKQQNLNMNLTSDLAEAGRIREENEFKLNRIVGRFPFKMIYGGNGVYASDSSSASECTEYHDVSGSAVADKENTDETAGASGDCDSGIVTETESAESDAVVSIMV